MSAAFRLACWRRKQKLFHQLTVSSLARAQPLSLLVSEDVIRDIFCFCTIKSEEKSNVIMADTEKNDNHQMTKRRRHFSWLIFDLSLLDESDLIICALASAIVHSKKTRECLHQALIECVKNEYLPLTSRLFFLLCQYHDELLSICRLNCSGRTFVEQDIYIHRHISASCNEPIWLIDDSPSNEIIVYRCRLSN